MIVLGIDPGRDKCGLAVVTENTVLTAQVAPRGGYLDSVRQWVNQYGVEQIVIGDGTGSEEFMKEIRAAFPNIPAAAVDERHTSEEARRRYWLENPPRGLKRLLPSSMQVPPEPFDHYVAVILAERFLAQKGRS